MRRRVFRWRRTNLPPAPSLPTTLSAHRPSGDYRHRLRRLCIDQPKRDTRTHTREYTHTPVRVHMYTCTDGPRTRVKIGISKTKFDGDPRASTKTTTATAVALCHIHRTIVVCAKLLLLFFHYLLFKRSTRAWTSGHDISERTHVVRRVAKNRTGKTAGRVRSRSCDRSSSFRSCWFNRVRDQTNRGGGGDVRIRFVRYSVALGRVPIAAPVVMDVTTAAATRTTTTTTTTAAAATAADSAAVDTETTTSSRRPPVDCVPPSS